MNAYRVAARTADGVKSVYEVDQVNNFAMAREFVIRETKAYVCLALVNPIEKPVFVEPEKQLA